MVVKSEFTSYDFEQILSVYNLGNFIAAKPFNDGAVQTNLEITAERGSYAFRYYETRSMKSALFEADLLEYLQEKGYPSPKPVKNRKGSAVGEFKGRPFALFKLLEGRHLQNPNNTGYLSCHDEISRAMASLHLLTQN